MSHKTRTILTALGLALSGVGSALITIANSGCTSSDRSFGLKVDATAYRSPDVPGTRTTSVPEQAK